MPSVWSMANFRLTAIIVGTLIITLIVTNVLIMLGLESVIFLIILGGLLALAALVLFASRFRNVYISGGEIPVPESLKNQLDLGEAIISRLTGPSGVDWYLTNKRLIHIQKNVEEPVRLLPIQGLTFHYTRKTSSRKTVLWTLSSLLSGIGVLLVVFAYLGFSQLHNHAPKRRISFRRHRNCRIHSCRYPFSKHGLILPVSAPKPWRNGS